MKKNKKAEPLIRAMLLDIGVTRIVTALLVTIFGGWWAFALAYSGIARVTNPQSALKYLPGESTALSRLADELYVTNRQKIAPQMALLARNALRQQTLNPSALRMLGLAAESKGNQILANKLLLASERLTRRDAGTQLWLIKYNALNNDAAKTLYHYDVVMMTKVDGPQLLFPALVSAIQDPAIRAAFLPYMHSQKPWVISFLSFAIGNSKNISPVVDLVLLAKGFPDMEASRNLATQLLARLVSEKKYQDAYSIFNFIPDADLQQATDASFRSSDMENKFGAMGWQLFDDPDAGGGFAKNAAGKPPSLVIFANSATTKNIARKLLYLPPASYKFSSGVGEFDPHKDGRIRWQMKCAKGNDNKPFWQLDVKEKLSLSTINVPSECKEQILEIIASGGDGQNGLETTINSVSIGN